LQRFPAPGGRYGAPVDVLNDKRPAAQGYAGRWASGPTGGSGPTSGVGGGRLHGALTVCL